MKNTSIFYIIFFVLLLAFGAYMIFGRASTEERTVGDGTETQTSQTLSTSPNEVNTVSNQPPSENPPDQGDVRGQPAYLVSAYTRHEKDYIGVDYVLVFRGDEAIEAQIEDGVCENVSGCSVPEGGYIRNANPHFRTYELSTTTPLVIEASGAMRSLATEMGLNPSALTFENLKELLPAMPRYVESEFPFKEAKTFVYLDIIGGGVTKIREP